MSSAVAEERTAIVCHQRLQGFSNRLFQLRLKRGINNPLTDLRSGDREQKHHQCWWRQAARR